MKKLRCTHCGNIFELRKEFDKCPECKIGTLVGGNFAKNGKPAIESASKDLESETKAQFEELNNALESFGITQQDYEEVGLDPSDDFFDSDYAQELGDEEGCYSPDDEMVNELGVVPPEHPNCPCINKPYHLNFLTIGDSNIHEFMCYTLDPISKENPKKICNKMRERFIRTFEKDATVPVGQRNS